MRKPELNCAGGFANIRKGAVAMALLGPKWNSRDITKAKAGVEALTMQSELARAAQESRHAIVRQMAVRKVIDQDLLSAIAKNTNEYVGTRSMRSQVLRSLRGPHKTSATSLRQRLFVSESPRYNLGSSGSLSMASTANVHSCTR